MLTNIQTDRKRDSQRYIQTDREADRYNNTNRHDRLSERLLSNKYKKNSLKLILFPSIRMCMIIWKKILMRQIFSTGAVMRSKAFFNGLNLDLNSPDKDID